MDNQIEHSYKQVRYVPLIHIYMTAYFPGLAYTLEEERTTNGIYLCSFVTHIFRKGEQRHGRHRKSNNYHVYSQQHLLRKSWITSSGLSHQLGEIHFIFAGMFVMVRLKFDLRLLRSPLIFYSFLDVFLYCVYILAMAISGLA